MRGFDNFLNYTWSDPHPATRPSDRSVATKCAEIPRYPWAVIPAVVF